MRSNIMKLYAVNFLTGIVFWYPIEKLFMRSIGITPFQVGINAVVFLLVTIIFDVPAGVLADKWKRTYTLMLALIALCLSDIILGASTSLIPYLFGTVFFGFYVVLTSGTFQALMYDSLHDKGQEKYYDKFQGKAYALFLAGVGFSSLAGGFIGAASFRAAYFLSIIPALVAVAMVWTIREPRTHKPTQDKHYFKHMARGFTALRQSPMIFHLALFAVIAGVLRSTQNEFGGLYYIALGLTAIPTGFANAAKWLSGSLGQLIGQHVGRHILKLIPLLFLLFAAFTVIHARIGLIFFLGAVLLHSMMQNQTEAELQNHISPDIRATTLSSISFTTNVLLVPLGLLFGWVAGRYSVFKSYQIIAVFGLIYSAYWIMVGRRKIEPLFREKAASKILEPIVELDVIK